MAGTLSLAWRNLGRNRRRTLITGVGLALGTGLCVVTWGIMDGMNADILHALTRLDLGHVQVHHPRYPKKKTQRLTLPAPDRVLKAASEVKAFRGMSRRLYGFALASNANKSAGVRLVGVEPAAEPGVTELHKQIARGKYLDRVPTPWPRGREMTAQERRLDQQLTRSAEDAALAEIEGLGEESAGEPAKPSGEMNRDWTRRMARALDPPPKRPPGALIGVDLARILKARLGDEVFVITQTHDGMSAEVHLRVRGIIKTGTSQYDRGRIYMHLTDLQRLLRLYGRVHEIALECDRADQAPQAAAALRLKLPSVGLKVQPVKAELPPEGTRDMVLVRSWDEIRPDITAILQLNSISALLMVIVIFIVAALGVINSMLMAVFERTRELGMLKAIGMSSGGIVRLILVETTLLVLVSSTLGTGLGLGLDLLLAQYGIDLSSFSDGFSVGGMGIKPVLHASITAQGVVVPTLLLVVMCFLGAFYPAQRAARKRPAEGMREV